MQTGKQKNRQTGGSLATDKRSQRLWDTLLVNYQELLLFIEGSPARSYLSRLISPDFPPCFPLAITFLQRIPFLISHSSLLIFLKPPTFLVTNYGITHKQGYQYFAAGLCCGLSSFVIAEILIIISLHVQPLRFNQVLVRMGQLLSKTER